MSNLDRLNEVAASLPESVLGELVDFAEFLKAKTETRTGTPAQVDTERHMLLEALRTEIQVGVAERLQGHGRPASHVFAELMADLPDETATRE